MEEWRDVKNYEGCYQVSNLGRIKVPEHYVKQKNRWGKIMERIQKPRLMKTQINKNGYVRVTLHKDGILKNYSIHRLVYEAFYGNIPDGMQVNHINEDKTDNRLENLNLMTPKENTNWGTANEKRTKNLINGKHSKAVQKIDPTTNEVVAEYPSTREAQRQLGCSQGHIAACCRGEKNFYNGFIWRYK